MREQREAWHPSLADVPADKLVFVDESGAKTNMTRLYGWGAVGERVVDAVPHGHWKTTTLIDALWQVMQAVLDQITPGDASNCFDHCGYTLRIY